MRDARGDAGRAPLQRVLGEMSESVTPEENEVLWLT